MFHLVKRGRENLREQTKGTFAIAVGSQNRRYVYQGVDELDKNHRENDDPQDSTTDGRMHEQPGPLCPVKTFELHLSKLHPELNFFGNDRNKQFKQRMTTAGIVTFRSKRIPLAIS